MADDDGAPALREFTREDIRRIKRALAEPYGDTQRGVFSEEEIETLKAFIDVWDDHSADFMAILKREQTSRLWAEVRERFWSVAKWFAAVLVGFIALLQSVQAVFNIDFTKWWAK